MSYKEEKQKLYNEPLAKTMEINEREKADKTLMGLDSIYDLEKSSLNREYNGKLRALMKKYNIKEDVPNV